MKGVSSPTEASEELAKLREDALRLGVSLSAETANDLLRYIDLLYVWNRSAGLTTIPREDALRLHVLDSVAAHSAIDASPCLDLGTGAGLPGLVLAMVLPERDFVLVESNRRRCSFLLEAVRVLGLGNVRVVESAVEALPDERYPLVISRAFRQPPEFVRIARGLALEGGRVVLLLASPSVEEMEELEAISGLRLEGVHHLSLPGGGEPRAIVSFRRD